MEMGRKINVSNAMYNSAIRLVLAYKTGKWRAPRVYGELSFH
jgi:hypothetical protein